MRIERIYSLEEWAILAAELGINEEKEAGSAQKTEGKTKYRTMRDADTLFILLRSE